MYAISWMDGLQIWAFGDFRVGFIELPQLEYQLELEQGDVVFMRSRLLQHSVTKINSGRRYWVVMFNHQSVQNRAPRAGHITGPGDIKESIETSSPPEPSSVPCYESFVATSSPCEEFSATSSDSVGPVSGAGQSVIDILSGSGSD